MSIKSSNFAKKHYNKCIRDNTLMLQILFYSVVPINFTSDKINGNLLRHL